jgi:hypothetical protein
MHTKEELVKEPEALEYAEKICRQAKQLYAVLAFVKKGPSIMSLLKEGVTDGDLPLTREKDDQGLFALSRKSGKPIQTFEEWSEKDREKFDRVYAVSPNYDAVGVMHS